ncbi:twin-arginine translocase TatA/TatE family subunit, partial [uncultured Adlercreutzia sp.]
MKILGLGVPELVIILVVVLLIFGPKNLPKLGASLGKTVKSLREGMSFDKDK